MTTKEKLAAYARNWRAANPEKCRTYMREYMRKRRLAAKFNGLLTKLKKNNQP